MSMVDEEVEIVLREIRERVRSMPLPAQTDSGATSVIGNGDRDFPISSDEQIETSRAEALARIDAYLTTTGRAWDRLPPIVSNRSGAKARLELWLKAKFKTLARWFTWEQVNFNAAVHYALRDTLQTLSDQETAIQELRARLKKEAEARQKEAEAHRKEAEAQRKKAEAQRKEAEAQMTEMKSQRAETDSVRQELRSEAETRRAELQNQRTETNVLRAEIRGESEARRIQIEDQRNQLQTTIDAHTKDEAAKLAELAFESRERDDQVQNEQRVLFKQLSLETSEAAVLQESARRKVGAALAELNQRLEKLEKVLRSGK